MVGRGKKEEEAEVEGDPWRASRPCASCVSLWKENNVANERESEKERKEEAKRIGPSSLHPYS